MSEHSGSGEGNDDVSLEDEQENLVGDDYSSDKGIEEENIPKHINEKKITIEQNEKDKTVATYVFYDEDHTLGNSLRNILSQRADVEFCGYSIPHPSENKLNLRLQTIDRNSNDVMKEGLITLKAICEVIENKFEEAIEVFGDEGKEEKITASPKVQQKELKKKRGKKK